MDNHNDLYMCLIVSCRTSGPQRARLNAGGSIGCALTF